MDIFADGTYENAIETDASYNQLFYFSEWSPEYVGMIFECDLPEIDVELFKSAIRKLVERHEILRTVFHRADGRLIQKVIPARDFGFEVTIHDVVVSDEEMALIIRKERTKVFKTDDKCFFFPRIYRLRKGGYKILFVLHHALTDAYSADIFRQELTQLYISILKRESSGLPGVPVQYREFAKWQRNFLQSPDGQRHKEYWIDLIKGFDPTVKFFPPGQIGGLLGGDCIFFSRVIDGDLYEEVIRFSRKNGLTRAALLMGLLSLLIHLLNKKDDITLIVSVSGRDSKYYGPLNIEGSIGCFANALFIRNRVISHMSVVAYLKKVQQNFVSGLNFGCYPVTKLLGELPGVTPSAEFLESIAYFNYHNYRFLKESTYTTVETEREGWKEGVEPGRCHFGLVIFEHKNCLKLSYRLRQDIFDEKRARDVSELQFSMLNNLLRRPELLIHELSRQ